jgi:hypothetical protein
MESLSAMKRSCDILIFILLFIFACAKVGFPPGGPEDKTPPEMITTIPAVGETRVNPNTTVQAVFSEHIKPLDAADAIFISPYPGDKVKYRIRGKKITVQFPEPLKADKTYVITFGTGIRDYRNNGLKETFALAFSTGDSLDEGRISGRIFGVEDAAGIDIWAYGIADSLSPDPSLQRPDYIVQCEKNGIFRFSHLSADRYRLFAVKDRAADRLYQPVEDAIGMTWRDVLLSRNGSLDADNCNFQLTVEDTLGPSLVSAVPQNRQLVHCQFDEAAASEPTQDQFTIVCAEDSLDTLTVHQVCFDGRDRRIIQVRTEIQNPARQYRICVKNLFDQSGNGVDPAYSSAQFMGNAQADTTAPALVKTIPAPGERSAALDGAIRLTFTETMDTVRFQRGFFFGDTLGNAIDGSIRWPSPLEAEFHASRPLESKKEYRLTLSGQDVLDLTGNALADTLFHFQTLNGDTLTELSGTVADPDSSGSGTIYINVRQVEKTALMNTIHINNPGAYRIGALLPGRYFLSCFRDRDGNGRYSFGRSFPFLPAERFVEYPDTVVLRSRWPNEGNDVILP